MAFFSYIRLRRVLLLRSGIRLAPNDVALRANGILPLAIPAGLWYNETKKGGKKMQEIKNKAQAIVDEYNTQLSSLGIRVLLSKKYFESSVGERDTYHPDAGVSLLKDVAAHLDKKKERKYKHERNRYHCFILSVSPIDQKAVPRECCKDYSFVLRKVERAHIGEKPQHIVYEERKVLDKIERRLQKILKRAEKIKVKKVCKDTIFDALRYCILPEYIYKKKICGKDRAFWDMIFIIFAVLLVIIFGLVIRKFL